MPCLDEVSVLALVGGRLDDDAAADADAHLDACRACRDLVVHAARGTLAGISTAITRATASVSGGADASETALPQGDRYELRELLGSGGQALVYLAHDQVLGRDVALKILRPDAAGGPRILDEARLIARLSHPHIVAIHDAGVTADGAVYLAMEHVAGGSLAFWLTAEPPPPRPEVVRVCAEAGRGLAAAHAAGVIHRDVKPANILVDSHGRARLGDFGLALEHAGGRGRGGGLAGTLLYMAPEQLDGEATAASDQFALACTAWEALTGRVPFGGRTPDERRAAIARGPGVPARPLPRHLAAALTRALAPDPARRWPSVDALVDALTHDARAARRRAGAGAAAVLTAAAVATGVWIAWPSAPAPSCADLDRELDGAWDAAARARVERAFAGSPLPFAPAAGRRAVAAIDRYAAAWLAARTASCEAARVRGEEAPALFALRTSCLDERKAALTATARALAAGDRAAVEHADDLTRGLPSLAPCSNTTWLLERVRLPDDPAARAAVAEAIAQRAESDAALRAGRHDEARAAIERATAAAARAQHAPTSAQVAVQRGILAARTGDFTAARTALEQAAELAQRGKDDVSAADAWVELVNVVGYGGGEYDEAMRLAGFAEATIARLGGDDVLSAALDRYRCAVLGQLGRPDEARARCEAARERYEDRFGPDEPRIANLLVLEARLAVEGGRFADADDAAARAHALRERVLGPEHPQLVETLFTLGQIARWQQRLDEAEAAYRRAAALAGPAFGEQSPVMGSLAAEMATLLHLQGKLDAALPEIDRAIAITERAAGPSHPSLIFHLIARGRILDDLDRDAEAIATFERAATIADAALPPEHPSRAIIRDDLAAVRANVAQPRP